MRRGPTDNGHETRLGAALDHILADARAKKNNFRPEQESRHGAAPLVASYRASNAFALSLNNPDPAVTVPS